MIRIDPIPLFLLPHTATITPKAGDGADWGAPGTGAVTVKNVRYQPGSYRLQSTDAATRYARGLLYIDAVNSDPFYQPKEGDTVSVPGLVDGAVVQHVDAPVAYGPEPHHYEAYVE